MTQPQHVAYRRFAGRWQFSVNGSDWDDSDYFAPSVEPLTLKMVREQWPNAATVSIEHKDPMNPNPVVGHITRYNPKPNANAEAVYFLREAPPAVRKQFPIATGVMDYFPDALALIALVSKRGNDQHNPGQPMHWARGKSDDQADTIARHLIDRGTVDSDKMFHSAKEAWRSVAMLQAEVEAFVREHGVEELLYVLGVMERPARPAVVGHIRPSDPSLK